MSGGGGGTDEPDGAAESPVEPRSPIGTWLWSVWAALTSPLLLVTLTLVGAVAGAASLVVPEQYFELASAVWVTAAGTVGAAHVAAIYRQGDDRSVLGVLRTAAVRFPTAVATYAIVGVAMVAVSVVLVLFLGFFVRPFVLIPLLLVIALYLLVRTSFVIPAVVVDHYGPYQAITGGWNLTRRATWRIVGLYVLLVLFAVPGAYVRITYDTQLATAAGSALSGVVGGVLGICLARLYLELYYRPEPRAEADVPDWQRQGSPAWQD